MEETYKWIILSAIGVVALILPFGFILLFGPQRFEDKEKKVKP